MRNVQNTHSNARGVMRLGIRVGLVVKQSIGHRHITFSIIDSIEGVLEGFGAFFIEIEKKFGGHGQICKYEKRLGKSVNLSSLRGIFEIFPLNFDQHSFDSPSSPSHSLSSLSLVSTTFSEDRRGVISGLPLRQTDRSISPTRGKSGLSIARVSSVEERERCYGLRP
jgi:hypothetical protein